MGLSTRKKLLYYVPERGDVATVIERAGLSRSIGKLQYARNDIEGSGPGPGNGMLILAHNPQIEDIGPWLGDGRGRYEPEKQYWQKCAGGKYWIGYYLDAKPGPSDLQRPRTHYGTWVEMVDENQWLVPAIIPKDAISPFPKALRIDENDIVWEQFLPQHRPLIDMAYKFWVLYCGGLPENEKPLYVEQIRAVETAMSLNYHVGCDEAIVMGLFSDVSVVEGIEAMCDARVRLDIWNAQEEAKKKIDTAPTPDGSDTVSGGPESSPDTSQLTPTSTSASSEG